MTKKNKLALISLNIFAIMFLLILLISSTFAYFKFSTYFYSEGKLPYLKLYANVESIDGSQALANIKYTGQTEQEVEVKFSTQGNTVSGKLRVMVIFEWDDNSLPNNPTNAEGETILAATIELDSPDLFDASNNIFKMKENFEPDSTITFMTAVKFAQDLPNDYLGHNVQVYILADLIQTNKEW